MKNKIDWKNNILIQKLLLRKDMNNIFSPGITDAEFSNIVIDYLLGENWYTVNPVGHGQVNFEALEALLWKYSKKFRAEVKQYNKEFKDICDGLSFASIPNSKNKALSLLKEKVNNSYSCGDCAEAYRTGVPCPDKDGYCPYKRKVND